MAYNAGTDPTLAELITAKFIPEIFSTKVLMTLKDELVIAGAVSHDYQSDLSVGSKVWIPVFGAATTAEVTPGTALSVQDLAGTAASITVDKWYGAAAEVSEMSKIQNRPEYLSGAAKEIAYAIGAKIDLDIGALFSTLTSSTVYGSDGQQFNDDLVIDISETLDEANVPTRDRRIIGDPSTRADIRKIDKWMSKDYISSSPALNGQLTEIYGMPILITNNLTAATTGSYGVMLHKSAIGVVIQQNPTAQEIVEPLKHRTVYQVKAIWGEDVIRTLCGKSFYTRKA